MTRRVLAVIAASALTFGAIVTACDATNPPSLDVGSFNQNYGPGAGSCSTPNEGCPCANEGAVVECGQVSGRSADGQPTCSMGYRRCSAGKYGACDTLSKVTPKPASGPSMRLMGGSLIPNGACANNPCDPYCQQISDSPDGGWMDDGGALGYADVSVDGPPGNDILAIIADGGKSYDGGIYHALQGDAQAIDPVNVSTTVNSVDVYFMFNSTVSMQSSITNLAAQIPTVVSSIQTAIPNSAFGEGRFTNYQSWPYGSQQSGNVVFQNRVSVSTTASTTVSDVQWMANNPGSVFVNTPYVVAQSTTPALYAMASNQSLVGWARFAFPKYGADWWWNVYGYYGERSDASLLSPFYQAGAVCKNGGVGAPCFRPNAYHIVLLFQDAPIQNGAGGSFPYYQFKPQYFPWNASADYTTDNSWYWYQSKSLGNAPPNLPTTNGASQLVSVPAQQLGKATVYTGNVSALSSTNQITANSVYDASAQQTCTLNGKPAIGTGTDVAFDFTVTQANQRYWFDTAGTSYDTILYLIDKNSGKIMGCADDSFAWLSAVDVLGTADTPIGKTNSALVGTLQPGSYRLVLDKFDTSAFVNTSSNKGIYQLNMWPDMDDPKLGGNPHGTAMTTPSYGQALAALGANGVNAMVAGIDMSGLTCGQQVTSWERAWTRWSLEQLATDTGAVVAGSPVVYSVQQNGTPGPVSGNDPRCPSGGNLGTIVSTAIANLTKNLAQPITAIAIDDDDLTDFDGQKGVNANNNPLTANNIDDATFVANISAQSANGCTGANGNTYAACTPGSVPNFQITFAIPQTVKTQANTQIFQFHIELHGVNYQLLSSTPVTIVVPAGVGGYMPTDFVRDFDGVSACPKQTYPTWTTYSWNTNDPSDSRVEYYLTTSSTLGGLATATEIPAKFGLANSSATVGAADLVAFMKANNVIPSVGYVRVRTHLVPSSDMQKTAVVNSYGMSIDCLPAQ